MAMFLILRKMGKILFDYKGLLARVTKISVVMPSLYILIMNYIHIEH